MIGGPADIQIEYDGVDITQHVIEWNGISIEALVEEVRSFGDSWDDNLPIGVGKVNDIEFTGLLDDSPGGPVDLFGERIPESPSSPPKSLKVTWFGAKTTEVQTYLGKFDRTPDKNEITKYTVMLKVAQGAPVET